MLTSVEQAIILLDSERLALYSHYIPQWLYLAFLGQVVLNCAATHYADCEPDTHCGKKALVQLREHYTANSAQTPPTDYKKAQSSKLKDAYLIECEKKSAEEIIKLLNYYKLRSKVDFINLNKKYEASVISLEKFKEIDNSNLSKGTTINYEEDIIYVDPRNQELGAKIISKIETTQNNIKKLNLNIADKNKYYNKSFELGIPQINLNRLKDKIFGVENNLDELNGIDFKKGCYVGQENTARIKLRNKLRRRILPVQKITGEISENDIIKYKDAEIGKIMISKPYSFGLIKVVDPDIKEFVNTDLVCGNSKVKIIKPEWI